MHLLWDFKFFQEMEKLVSTAQARADWGSGHSFLVSLPPLLLLPFVHHFFMVFGSLREASEAFEIEACRRLGTKRLVGERFQKNTKTKHQKSKKI